MVKKSFKKMKKSAVFILITFFVGGCAVLSPKANLKNSFIVFYVDTGVNQYFVKPLKFNTLDKKFVLTIDFTFRDTLKEESFAIVNWSIFSDTAISKIDSIKINSYRLKDCKRMFITAENNGKFMFQIRYTCGLEKKNLLKIFKADTKISVFVSNRHLVFYPTKRTVRIMKFVNETVIRVLELNEKGRTE